MPGGGLLQISAASIADNYMFGENGQNTMSFFKTLYRTYSNFSRTNLDLNFKTASGFDKLMNILIPRNGDLLHNLYLKITLPSLSAQYIYTPDQEIALLYSQNNTFDHNLIIYNENQLRLNYAYNFLTNNIVFYLIKLNSNDYIISDYLIKIPLMINTMQQSINYYLPNDNFNYLFNQLQFFTDASNNKLNENTINTFLINYSKHFFVQMKRYTVVLNSDISSWNIDSELFIYLSKNNSYLQSGVLVVNNYTVSNSISTIDCFFESGDITTFIVTNLIGCNNNYSSVISITDNFSIDSLRQFLCYLLTYDDIYNYLIYFLSSTYQYSNINQEVFTANKFISGISQLLNNFIFDQHYIFTFNQNLSNWIYPTQLYITYKSNLQFYNVIFLYDTNLNQYGYGIIYNITYQTYQTIIDFVFIAGQYDTLPIYISPEGTLDLNDTTTHIITDFTNIIKVTNYNITINNELSIYNNLEKINTSQYATINASDFISNQLQLVFNSNLLTTWNRNIIYLSGLLCNIVNINITNYETTINIQLLVEPGIDLSGINNHSLLTYTNYYTNQLYSINIDNLQITNINFNVIQNNTLLNEFNITLTIYQNLINWFFGDLYIAQDTITNSTQANIILSPINISTSSNQTIFILNMTTINTPFNISFNIVNSIPISNFIDLNSNIFYLFDSQQLLNVEQIEQINFVFYDNYYTFAFDYNNSLQSSMLLSMTNNYQILENIYNELFNNIQFIFRAFNVTSGIISNSSPQVIVSNTNIFSNLLSNVDQTINYPFLDEITTNMTSYNNYFLTNYSNTINNYITITNFSLINNITNIISFLQTTNYLENIVITLNISISISSGSTIYIKNSTDPTSIILAELLVNSVNNTILTCTLISSPISLINIIINNQVFYGNVLIGSIVSVSSFFSNYTTLLNNYTNPNTISTYFTNFLLLDYLMKLQNNLLSYNNISNTTKYLFTLNGNLNINIGTISYLNNDNITLTINTYIIDTWNLSIGDILEIRELQTYGYYRTSRITITNLSGVVGIITYITCSLNTDTFNYRLLEIPLIMYSSDDTLSIQITSLTYTTTSITIFIDKAINWGPYLNSGQILNFRETFNNSDLIIDQIEIIQITYNYQSTIINANFISLINNDRMKFVFDHLFNSIHIGQIDIIDYNSDNYINLIFNENLQNIPFNTILKIKYTEDSNDVTRYRLILNNFRNYSYSLYTTNYVLLSTITSLNIIDFNNITFNLSSIVNVSNNTNLIIVQNNSNYIMNFALMNVNNTISNTSINCSIIDTNFIRILPINRYLYISNNNILINNIVILNNIITLTINSDISSWDFVNNNILNISLSSNCVIYQIILESISVTSNITTIIGEPYNNSINSNLQDCNKVLFSSDYSLYANIYEVIQINSTILQIIIKDNLMFSWGANLNIGNYLYIKDGIDPLKDNISSLIIVNTSFDINTTYINVSSNNDIMVPLYENTINCVINTSTFNLNNLSITQLFMFSFDDTMNVQINNINIIDTYNIILTINSDISSWNLYQNYLVNIRYTNNNSDTIQSKLIIWYFNDTTILCRLISDDTTIQNIYMTTQSLMTFDNTIINVIQFGNPIIANNSLLIGDQLNVIVNDQIYCTIITTNTTSTNINYYVLDFDNSIFFRNDNINYQNNINKLVIQYYDYLYKYLINTYNNYLIDYPNLTNATNTIYIGEFTDFNYFYNTTALTNDILNLNEIPNLTSILSDILQNYSVVLSNNVSIDILLQYLNQFITSSLTSSYSFILFTNQLLNDITQYFSFYGTLLNMKFSIGYTIDNYNSNLNVNLQYYNDLVINNIITIPLSISNLAAINTDINNVINVTNQEITYYNANSNILNIKYLNLNNSTYYSTDATLIENEIISEIHSSLYQIQIYCVGPTSDLWSTYLQPNDILNIRTTSDVSEPIITSINIITFSTNSPCWPKAGTGERPAGEAATISASTRGA